MVFDGVLCTRKKWTTCLDCGILQYNYPIIECDSSNHLENPQFVVSLLSLKQLHQLQLPL